MKNILLSIILISLCLSMIYSIEEKESKSSPASLKFLEDKNNFSKTSSELVKFITNQLGGHKFSLQSAWKKEVYMRHYTHQVIISKETEEDLFKKDASWYLERGLNGKKDCFSFRSDNYPNDFIRYKEGFIYKHEPDGSDLFDDEASWRLEFGTYGDKTGYVLESCNQPGLYFAHNNWKIMLLKKDGTDPNSFVWNFVKPKNP